MKQIYVDIQRHTDEINKKEPNPEVLQWHIVELNCPYLFYLINYAV